MNRHVTLPALLTAASLCSAPSVSGQQTTLEPDRLEVFNRTATRLIDGTRTGIHLSESADNGVAYPQGIELGNGTIELDVRGKDVPQQSFVGVAFHGVDGTTYDAIYFRPFNFKTDDSVRCGHCVQFVSHPTYRWQKRRAEQPGKYAQPVSPAPDPNGWFPVRVVVAAPQVKVFVNEAKNPSLVELLYLRRGDHH